MKQGYINVKQQYVAIALVLQLVVVVGAAALIFHVPLVNAITDTIISQNVRMNRLRLSFADIKNSATTTDPGDSCGGLAKRVIVYTVPAAGQVDSIITKATVPFAGGGVVSVPVRAIRAEQGGVQLSVGDIGQPTGNLNDLEVNNQIPPTSEYAFYDETSTWDIVAYICGQDDQGNPISLSALNAGSVDFYIQTTKP